MNGANNHTIIFVIDHMENFHQQKSVNLFIFFLALFFVPIRRQQSLDRNVEKPMGAQYHEELFNNINLNSDFYLYSDALNFIP